MSVSQFLSKLKDLHSEAIDLADRFLLLMRPYLVTRAKIAGNR